MRVSKQLTYLLTHLLISDPGSVSRCASRIALERAANTIMVWYGPRVCRLPGFEPATSRSSSPLCKPPLRMPDLRLFIARSLVGAPRSQTRVSGSGTRVLAWTSPCPPPHLQPHLHPHPISREFRSKSSPLPGIFRPHEVVETRQGAHRTRLGELLRAGMLGITQVSAGPKWRHQMCPWGRISREWSKRGPDGARAGLDMPLKWFTPN